MSPQRDNRDGQTPLRQSGDNFTVPTHVIPLAIEAALKQDRTFTVNGSAFDTRDGTAVRDYVHVDDLARAHVLAAEKLLGEDGVHVYNLGTGVETTVRELIEAVSRVSGSELRVAYGPPRPGDPPILVAAPGKAERELGWVARQSSIDRIVETAFKWYRRQS